MGRSAQGLFGKSSVLLWQTVQCVPQSLLKYSWLGHIFTGVFQALIFISKLPC